MQSVIKWWIEPFMKEYGTQTPFDIFKMWAFISIIFIILLLTYAMIDNWLSKKK
jgi:ABC-type amino acid transport system permease subunit